MPTVETVVVSIILA